MVRNPGSRQARDAIHKEGEHMPTKTARPKKFIKLHADGSIWAKGQTLNGVPTGYWEFFRKDGIRMGSGYFEDGKQAGKWTTYDKKGKVYKVRMIKPKGK